MGKHEKNRPSRIRQLIERTQAATDSRLINKLDKIIRKAQPNAPDEQLPKLRRYMIDTSKMPAFVRRKQHKKLERYETRQQK